MNTIGKDRTSVGIRQVDERKIELVWGYVKSMRQN